MEQGRRESHFSKDLFYNIENKVEIWAVSLFHPQKLINMHIYDNQLFANVEDLNVWIRCCIYGVHITWLVSLSRRRKNTFNVFLACIDICITCLYFKAFLSLHVLTLSPAEASLRRKERDKESSPGGGGGGGGRGDVLLF